MSHEKLIYLATWRVYNPDLPGEQTLYFSSGHRGYRSKPTDTPASQPFTPRLQQPAKIRRTMFSEGSSLGETRIALGEMIYANVDGGLDYLLRYGTDGREITVYIGPEDGSFPTDFKEVGIFTSEQVDIDETQLRVRLRDRQYETKRPVQRNLYLGNNVLPDGLEGTADDLEGKPKPLTWGRRYNVTGFMVNTARLIVQWHDGAIHDLPEVFDKGKPLTRGADYTSQADMEANIPAAGTYRAWLGGGMARLGSNPEGTVTANVVEGATAAARTVGQIYKRILIHSGVPAADIDDAAINILDTAFPAEAGIDVGQAQSTAEVIQRLTYGAIGWGQNAAGLFTIWRLTAPTGTAVATFKAATMSRLKRVTANEPGGGLPARRVVVGYARNATVQEGDALAATVPQDRRAWLANEYRTVAVGDDAVAVAHLLAPTLHFETPLAYEADAAAEANRLFTLRRVQRDRFEARVKLDHENPQLVTLGSEVKIVYDRYLLQAGRNFVVVGMEPDLRRGILELTLWG